MAIKYCDDADCPNFQGGNIEGDDCQLGFKLRFRVPHSMADAVYRNWGYVMPKACQRKRNKPRLASSAESKG